MLREHEGRACSSAAELGVGTRELVLWSSIYTSLEDLVAATIVRQSQGMAKVTCEPAQGKD